MKFAKVFSLLLFSLLLSSTLLAEPYKVGVILPLSGDFAPYGKLVQQGISRADSKGIRVIYEDDACDTKRTISAFKKLTEIDAVKFIIGPSCGSPQQSIAPFLKQRDVLAIIASSATENLRRIAGDKLFFTQYSIEDESKFIANQMNQKDYSEVAIVYFDNEFSRAHEKAFEKSFKGKIVLRYRYNSLDINYLKDAALKIKKLAPDAVYVPDVSPFLLGLLSQFKKTGIKNTPVYSVYSAQMKEVLEVESPNAEGLFYSYPDISNDNEAISYFPQLAADMLFSALRACKNNVVCVRNYLNKNYDFDDKNVLRSQIILKTVRDGRFVRLN